MDTFEKTFITIIVLIILLVGAFIHEKCKRQAIFYTKLTGIEVTKSDALFLDLDTSEHVVKLKQNP